MKGKTWLSVLAAAVLLVTALPATLGPAFAAGDASTLMVLVPNPPTTLDPAVNYETAGGPFLGAVYDPLVKAVGSTKPEIVPWLAESWEKSADGLTYTFKLRPGVKFHDGTLLNAAAVKFSFERMFAMNAGAVANFNTVIDTIDASILSSPSPVSWLR
jgi:peptide/nickel transport system substrate-binding protein